MSGSARKTRSKFRVLRGWRAAQAGQKGGRAGGVARTHGRGVSEGGYTWAILYDPMFLFCFHVTVGLMVSIPDWYVEGPRFESRSKQSHKMKPNSIFDKFNLKSSSSFLPSSIVLSTVITIFSRSWRVTMMHDTPCRWVIMSYHDTGVNGSGRYLSSPIYLHQLQKLFKLNFSKIELSFPNRLDLDTNLYPLEHQPGLLTNRLPVTYRKGKHEPYYS